VEGEIPQLYGKLIGIWFLNAPPIVCDSAR